MKSTTTIKDYLYDKAVEKTLKYYERWVLPKGQLTSLRDIKLKEFNDRRKLLNPY